ncbi:hypothetical protein BGY98DRAFT_1096424 [Russula aff. rugulosa BPL654]|nr:hypothetical protein BGY98DRAFT_1096424 [Russula aff. rugulosa BPL654]
MLPPLLFLQQSIEDIVIHSIDDDPLSFPPRSLLPLMLTCKLFRDLLHPSYNPHLYRRIFCRKFDIAAIARRFPSPCVVSSRFHPELKKRFLALRRIRLGDIDHPHLEGDFLTFYTMLLEHDALNHRLLVDAGLPALLDKYMAEHLHCDRNGWPTEDTCNVLAVALFWHMTSQDTLNGESFDSRNKVVDILLPLTLAWFRYSFLEQGCDPRVFTHGGSSSSRLSSPTHPSPVSLPIDYMGHTFGLRLPSITLSATLALFARLDAFPMVLPPFRPFEEQSENEDLDGPTVEDIELYNQSFHTLTIPRGPGCPGSASTCHDWDWLRAVAGDPFMSDSVRRYTPGMLTGKWRGTEMRRYAFHDPGCRTSDFYGSRIPFSWCLEEHVRYSKADERFDPCHVPLFPTANWTKKEDGMEFFDGRSSANIFYKTFSTDLEKAQSDTNLDATDDQEIVDVILSGRSERHIQPAWQLTGRVRISDGLVVLFRQYLNGRLPRRSIYAGYRESAFYESRADDSLFHYPTVLSSQNFVGKWMYSVPDAQWEGVWALCKAR